MISITILANHTTLVYYAHKSKLYFLQNATTIFCSLVKIITTHTHTRTHARIYKETNKKNFSVNLSRLWQHIASHIPRRQPQILSRCASIFIYMRT